METTLNRHPNNPSALTGKIAEVRIATYDLVVIIVNWNVRELLRACLKSLPAALEGLCAHTVVVDNASTDGSREMVAAEFPEVELIANADNLGFAGANNQALLKYAQRARYQLLLNPDTVATPGSIAMIAHYLDDHADVGIAGCKLLKPDGTLDYACKRSYITPDILLYKALALDRRFPKSERFGKYQLTFADPDCIREVDSVVGAFMMIRRECLAEIGALDHEAFFMYGEDIDYCYRAKAAGWRLEYVPIATVFHHKGQSTGKCSNHMIFYWYAATWKVYRRHLAKRYSLLTNGLVWAGCYGMCGLSLVANILRRSKRVPSRR